MPYIDPGNDPYETTKGTTTWTKDWPTNSNNTHHYLCEGRMMRFFLEIILIIQHKICVLLPQVATAIHSTAENNNEISKFSQYHLVLWTTTVFSSLWADNHPIVVQ
jgi:hypothetical protein